jgi:acyl carrier protein
MMKSMSNDLNLELKNLIVSTLNLEDVNPGDIGDDDPLFGTGLELDSIDGLELVLKLEKTYGIKIGSSEASREALQSVNVLAEFIRKQTASGA